MPSATIISGDIDELRPISEVVTAAGWDVSTVLSGPAALVIVDIRRAVDQVDIGRIREMSTIMIGIVDPGVAAEPCDDVIERPLDRAAIEAVILAWSPPSAAVLDRLSQAFGTAALRPLVEGLRDDLRAALAADLSSRAHRLAGLSGTLGFAVLGAALEAVSRGETASLGDARRHAKTALLTIDTWLATAAA